jgi:phage repressor protein C with HTH and peptisase S24 domain
MKKILNINERIFYLIENQYNDNQKKFAESIGYSAQVVFNIVSGRKSSPSYDVLNAIISTNDDLSPEWLLTGKGSMLKSANPKNGPVFRLKTDNDIQHQSVPLYDIQASASVVALFRDNNNEKPIDHITIPNLPKCDGAIYVSGDSMYPMLKSGDIIMYKKVGTALENMFWGEMYVVTLINDDGDEFVMVKWLHKSELGQEYVKLVSENRHHQPKDFHIKNIKGLALIKASVRVNSMY